MECHARPSLLVCLPSWLRIAVVRAPDVESPTDGKTIFLRSLANRLYDEDVFSVVVSPYFDHLHRNHIHGDLARYRVDGSRK